MLGLALLLAAAAGAPASHPAPPRLVLAISIDQMRFDYLTRFGPLFKGGFRALLDRGAVFTNARYRHANTETGPGHSVLLSGRNARHSGIVANEWYDPMLKRQVNVVEDPAVSPLGGPGRGASPTHFLGFTVGDMLKKRAPASRVVGVALKDRTAILMTGPRADAAYWYEVEGGNFITSTYYMKDGPAWLAARNARRPADRLAGKTWTRLLADEGLYRKYAGPDEIEGEGVRVDTVFPHPIRGQPPSLEYYEDIKRTPFVDQLVLEVALEAMAAHGLGRGPATDVLAVGFSATDAIGHAYGPDSQEIMDQMLRLDVTLGKLLQAVDARVGAGRTLVVLSADHGVMPLVEVLQARGIEARRVRPEPLEATVIRALAERFPGATGLVALAMPPDYYLDLEAIRRQGLKREDVEAVIEKALWSTGLLERVYTRERLLGEPPADDPYFELVLNSFFEPRSPHVIGLLKPHVYMGSGGRGLPIPRPRPDWTTHGTPYDYDRHVPIVFMGPGVKPGTYPDPCGPEDIAPSLAALLGLDYPQQDAQRLLTEMMR